MTDVSEFVQSVSVLDLRPGDTLVLKVDMLLSPDQAERVKETVKRQLTVDVPILIVPLSAQFEIMRPAR